MTTKMFFMTIIGHHKASSSPKLPRHWSCKPQNNLMSINDIIQCICHDALTSRFLMKDNLPPWRLWLTLKKYLLNMQRKHKRFIKLMQQMLEINKQKDYIISLVGRVAFVVIPIFHSFARK